MKSALRIYAQTQNDVLEEQLSESPFINAMPRETILNILREYGIVDLRDATVDTQLDYRAWIFARTDLSETQKVFYGNLFGGAVLAFYRTRSPKLLDEIARNPAVKRVAGNKAAAFLLQSGIYTASDISYEIRQQYQGYLEKTVAASKILEYVKTLDILKLEAIKADRNPLFTDSRVPRFEEKAFFLLYYPVFEIAESFYYTRDKEELLFDFGLKGTKKLKKQIFDFLVHKVITKKSQKLRHESFLVPLKKLYLYCIEHGIADIEMFMQCDIEGFCQSMEGKVGTKLKVYLSVVDNLREYVFLNAEKTNWKATVWYLDRFSFPVERHNPANQVRKFRFTEIQNAENCEYFQGYIRYLLGITDKAIVNIRSKFAYIHEFLMYCEEHQIYAVKATTEQMETYFSQLGRKSIQSETFNKAIVSIYEFFEYWQSKRVVVAIPFTIGYYYKKYFAKHHDRIVPEDFQMRLLESLKLLPYHLRLMFLTLWTVGLRLEEVCSLTGETFILRDGVGFIWIRQTKQRNEKIIPVPRIYYDLMTDYIKKMGIGEKEFIFKNAAGGAYCTGTFRKQMKKHCDAIGLTAAGYKFQAHDYRHTVATDLHDTGISIQALREYLGHRHVDMTKQYIDMLPKRVAKMSDEYFAKEENCLVSQEDRKHG